LRPEWELERDEEVSNFVSGRKKTQQMTGIIKGGQMIQSWLALLFKGPFSSSPSAELIRSVSLGMD
jgi:hypothetical protein